MLGSGILSRQIGRVVSLLMATSLLASFALAQAGPQTPPVQNPPAQKPSEKNPFDSGEPKKITTSMDADQKSEVLKAIQKTLMERAFVPGVDFAKWESFITGKQEAIDKADSHATFTRAVNTALREFGFSHIVLQSPQAAQARGRTRATGMGVGVAPNDKGLVIRRVFEGSPADKAGLKENDVIVKVNGEKPTARENIEGEKGAKLKLEVLKTDGTTVELEVELNEYSTVRKETLTWIGEDTAVLRVFTFSAGYGRENIEGHIKAANGKAKNLILDLRSNGGGAINNLNHLLSLLMPVDTEYGTFVSRKMANDFASAKPGEAVTPESIAAWATGQRAKTKKQAVEPFNGKIAVLINRGSGSASEICTAALRERVGAKVLGTKSAGAVLASVYARLPQGFSLQHPVSDYVTQMGMRLEKNPLVPDVEVTAVRIENGPDPVVEKAVEVLKAAQPLVNR